MENTLYHSSQAQEKQTSVWGGRGGGGAFLRRQPLSRELSGVGKGGTERAGERLLWAASGKCKGPEAGLSLLSSRMAGIPGVRVEGGRGRMVRGARRGLLGV